MTIRMFAENAIMSGIAFWKESYNGNPILNEIQLNNYKYSTIRAYLNGTYEADDFQQFTYENNGFLQTAFTASAQEKILTTYVVNDAASTSDYTGTLRTADEYICGPTFDKIFLLSKKKLRLLLTGSMHIITQNLVTAELKYRQIMLKLEVLLQEPHIMKRVQYGG